MVIKNNFADGKKAIKCAVITLVWMRIRWQQGTPSPLTDLQYGFSIRVAYLSHIQYVCRSLKSYFCKAAAVRFVVSDVRGQITTHRAGAAGYSIFAIVQWRLERNYWPTRFFPTASELEQMLQASDNWTLGCVLYIQYVWVDLWVNVSHVNC